LCEKNYRDLYLYGVKEKGNKGGEGNRWDGRERRGRRGEI
jgi:hypothetical protein